jgi:phospholipid/cholesterol/gamma-HCH transport system substrate-binding protein
MLLRAGVLGLAASLLTGCGSLTLQGVPLPGGASLGSDPYTVTVQFRDVLDLVPQAAVKVNNITVGQVRTIDLEPQHWNANVHVVLNGDVKLPANATAQLKQTTLLGEKYVELFIPTDTAPTGRLTDGAVIPVSRTNRFPEVEEIFGALSMLLNGGGIGQVQSISKELNTALTGHEGDTRALLDDLNLLVTTLDGQKSNITRALDGVDRLSASLADQRGHLDSVLQDLEPGLAVLNEQRPQLVGLLKSLDKLSDVAVNVVNRSHDDLIADLKLLQPTLRELAKTGDTLPQSLEVFATPPFVDAAVPAAQGDYLNLNLKINLDVGQLLQILLTPPSAAAAALPDPLSLLPKVAPKTAAPKLPGLLSDPGKDTAPTPQLPGGLPLPGLGGDK